MSKKREKYQYSKRLIKNKNKQKKFSKFMLKWISNISLNTINVNRIN